MCSYPSSELQWRPYTQQSRNHVIFNGYSTSAADRSRWPLTRQEKLWHDLAPALRREAVNRTAHGYPCPGRKFTSITSLRKTLRFVSPKSIHWTKRQYHYGRQVTRNCTGCMHVFVRKRNGWIALGSNLHAWHGNRVYNLAIIYYVPTIARLRFTGYWSYT